MVKILESALLESALFTRSPNLHGEQPWQTDDFSVGGW